MKLKRAGTLFLALALALTFLPASALAVNEESAGIAIGATHQTVDTNGKYLDFSGVQTIDPLHFTIVGDTSEESINLWPTSSNMISAGEDDGSTVPYLVDSFGETWYLSSIQWANGIPGLNPSATGEILSSSEIYNAALDSSKEAYNFDPSTISGEPETTFAPTLLKVPSAYYICYSWTTTPPEEWEGSGELPTKYTVNYDINLPSGVTQLYRIMYDEQRDEDYLEITDQGALNNVKTEVSALTRGVYEGRNFYVAAGLDSRYRGFLAFSDPSGEDVSYYYLSFDDEEPDKTKYPWMTEDDTITYYKSGDPVQATSDLADETNTITLKANWVEIDPLTEDELAAADDALTLDVFERGGYYDGGSAVVDNVVENDLLLQWTSVDENLDGYGIKTGNDVMLDEESTISYLLTARLNSTLTNLRDNATYGDFANFKFTLNIDNQLEFANVENDQVSIVFSSAFLKPVVTAPTNITGATVANEGNGSYKITFNPANVPTSTDGTSMQIEINVEWSLNRYSTVVSEPIQISGLDFKLKDTVTNKENFTLNSSANITGSMEMKKRSNIRFYYTAAYSLLNGSSEWQAHFKGNGADPVALVHALQFMDYKLANYDMSKEEDPDGPTNALTSGSCTAKASYTAYTITATAGTGGSISPGTTQVYKGDDQPFTITPNEGFEIADITVDNEKVDNVAIQENGTATYTFEDVTSNHTIAATFKSTNAVTFAPADIIVYMGGTRYEGAVDENGTVISNVNAGLPEPGFRVDLPAGLEGTDLATLTFKETGGGNRTWKLTPYDGKSKDIYKLVPADSTSPTRMQFTKADGTVIPSDEFEVGREVNTSFGMRLYNDENTGTISVEISGVTYPVESTSGTLYVRGTTDEVRISSVNTTAPASGQPGAVAPAGTTYTINGGDVLVTDTSGVSLLFDEIIDTTSENRTSQLEDRAEESLPQLSSNRDYAYQFKYLDLVDANNGNAWVKASQDLTIYWPLPEGVDTSTLRVLHFEGLHRDMTSTNVEDAISGCTVTTVPHTVSGNYVTFQIGESGFSPFALVWETTTGGGGGGTTRYTITAEAGEGGSISPSGRVSVTRGSDKTFTISAAEGYVIADVLVDGESIGAVDSYTFENVRQNHTIEARFQPVSDVADPDDTGVSDWLNTDDHLAYLDGYPDNTFQPEEDMTRAEAAQMFYNLLRDQDVDTTVSFTDVAADAWYAEAVNTLATLEIVDGVGDNRFAPERTITRAEFTTMAMRFCQEIPTGENIFSDVDQDDWFYDYVVGSIQYGWINGYPDGTFRPNDTITRAEVTTIANRMLGRAADEAYVDGHQDQLRAFPDVTKGYWAYYDITEATNAHTYTQDSQGEDWTGLA